MIKALWNCLRPPSAFGRTRDCCRARGTDVYDQLVIRRSFGRPLTEGPLRRPADLLSSGAKVTIGARPDASGRSVCCRRTRASGGVARSGSAAARQQRSAPGATPRASRCGTTCPSGSETPTRPARPRPRPVEAVRLAVTSPPRSSRLPRPSPTVRDSSGACVSPSPSGSCPNSLRTAR